tara:strand:+ start:246 stop:557 length:312 start_codon:yes stop_codon:yes gene_type:complete
MADKSKFMQTPWFERASDKSTPTTEANQTVFTSSFEEDGVIYLVPTIRMNNEGKLFKPEDPLQYAKDKGDFLTGFKTEDEATDFSKMISTMVDMNRKENKKVE